MIKEVFSLASSAAIGQVISLCVLLAVARLISVEAYGGFAVCITLVGYVLVLASAKYHHAVFSASLEDAEKITSGSFVFIGGLATALFLISSLIKRFLDVFAVLSFFDLMLIVISGFLSASSLFYYYLCLRKDQMKKIFKSRVIPPVASGVGMVTVAALDGTQTGLLIFYTLGNLLTLFILRKGNSTHFDFDELLSLLKKYKRFPLFLLPAGALEAFNSGFLLLASAHLFGVEASAAIGLYLRLVASPQGLIVSSVGDILRKRIISCVTLDIKKLLLKVGLSLTLLALTGAFVIYFFSEYGIGFVLGEKWVYAGKYFQWMLPVFIFSFVVSSLSVVLYIFNGQKYDLSLQVMTALMYSCIYLFLQKDLKTFVFAFVGANCLKYVVELYLSVKCVSKREL